MTWKGKQNKPIVMTIVHSTLLTVQTPFTLNLLINLLIGCLLVGLRQITGTRRLRLSVALSYRLKLIILSLLVTCRTPSLLKLHLERAGASICQSKYLLSRREVCGRNSSTPVDSFYCCLLNGRGNNYWSYSCLFCPTESNYLFYNAEKSSKTSSKNVRL